MYTNSSVETKKNERIKTKDLITIGILSAIFVIVYLIPAMTLGIIPLASLFVTAVAAVPAGVIFMLLLAKVPKAGALSLAGIVFGLVMLQSGHFWLVLVIEFAGPILADIFYSLGDRKSFARMAVAFTIYMVFLTVGAYSPMLLLTGPFVESMGGVEGPWGLYITEVLSYLTWPMLGLIVIATAVGSLVGALLGRKLLHKHFVKAGIV